MHIPVQVRESASAVNIGLHVPRTYRDINNVRFVAMCTGSFEHDATVNGCYAVVKSNLAWSDAGDGCRDLDERAHLVVVDSAAEQSALAALLAGTTG